MEKYSKHRLENGLQIVHLPQKSSISYCGVAVNVGSRDEKENEQGMSHLIEHMLFKGTKKRTSNQIINRLETVGGELNAYTTKEETVIYAGFLKEYTKRAIELIADIVQNSIFPEKELKKEVIIVMDEIQSYNDSPSELIFDDFEELIFDKSQMAHNILGTKKHLKTYKQQDLLTFYQKHYTPDEMVFFSTGETDFKKIVNWCEQSFIAEKKDVSFKRTLPQAQISNHKSVKKKTNQVHCMIGAGAYNYGHKDRLALYLLNNILGGPGLNSLLNLSLREKHGLVYSVESVYQPFTDSGWWAVYYGADPENAEKCDKLIRKELKNLRENKISDKKLGQYKVQLMGQMAISFENKEHTALSLGKSILRSGNFNSLEEIQEKISKITSEQILKVANEIFDEKKLNVLKYV